MVEQRRGLVENHDIDAVDPESTHQCGGQVRDIPERRRRRSWLTKVHGHVHIAVRLGRSGRRRAEQICLENLLPRLEEPAELHRQRRRRDHARILQ